MMYVLFQAVIILAALFIQQRMFLEVISSEAKQDYRDIIRDGSRNSLTRAWHSRSFVKILLLGVGVCLPFAFIGGDWTWEIALSLLCLNGAEFALLFDRNLNRLRGLDDLYVGQNSRIDLFFRKFFADRPGRALLVAKIVFIVIGAGSLLFFLGRYLMSTSPEVL